MSVATAPRASAARRPRRTASRRTRVIGWCLGAVVLIAAMAFGTKFVSSDSSLGSGPQKFSAAGFAADNFPKVQAAISKRAVPAATLAAALKTNEAAATKKYAQPVPGAPGPEFSVSLTGTVGRGESGIYPVTVPGLRKGLLVRIQTGPAINGTDLRDATGKYTFGQFTNQIDYQNAAAGLNQQMKKDVLSKLDVAHLAGKKVSVVGAFQLINPDGWLITPVKLSLG